MAFTNSAYIISKGLRPQPCWLYYSLWFFSSHRIIEQ